MEKEKEVQPDIPKKGYWEMMRLYLPYICIACLGFVVQAKDKRNEELHEQLLQCERQRYLDKEKEKATLESFNTQLNETNRLLIQKLPQNEKR